MAPRNTYRCVCRFIVLHVVSPSQPVVRLAKREAREAARDQALVERATEAAVGGVPFLCIGRRGLVELLRWVGHGCVDALVPVVHVAGVEWAVIWSGILACWVGGRLVRGLTC